MNTNNKNKNLYENWKLVNFCEFDKYAEKSYCAIHGVDENKNLGDITKVDETKLSPFNMICGGSPCFVKGTKVLTDCGYKNIEDIKVGDMVLTHKNRYMPVVNIGGEYNKEIFSLRVQGFLKTECTDYHPFYCKKNKNSIPEKIKLKDIKNGYFLGSHINTKSDNIYNLSNEDCWILGRYVADGHIRKEKRKERINSYQYQCILSIGDNKVAQLKEIIKEHNYSCYPHTESMHRVVFSSMKLVNFIINNNFGRNAETKRIPKFILDLPVDKLQNFLEGYMAGDGCNIDNKYQATTVSRELAMSLCLVVQKVYRVGCNIYFDERPDKYEIQGRIVNQKDTYMVRFIKEPQKHSWFIENNIVWYPVKEIKNTERLEDVYNIEVEEDHTYTANNMIVYNCQDFSVAGKQKGSVWTCKDCGHEYNPLTVHWSERDKCPNCGGNNIEKTRSSLLVEYLRVIRANKPNFGIYENVKNIVGKQFKETTFKLFTDELEEYGYNVYWEVLNSKNYGIPQNRERVYLIFIKKDLDNGKFKFPEPFDNGKRLKDILEDKVDEKFYLSNKMLEKMWIDFSKIGKKEIDIVGHSGTGGQKGYIHTKNGIIGAICATEYKQPKQIIEDNTINMLGLLPIKGNEQVRRVYGTDGVSPTLNTMQGGNRQPKIVETKNTVAIPQATKAGYIEFKIGSVADLSYPGSKTRRGRIQENGDVSYITTATETGVCRIEYNDKVICASRGRNPENPSDRTAGSPTVQRLEFNHDNCTNTLTSVQKDNYVFELDNIRIRKLTPRECFRLMGFSDDTFEKVEEVVSNTQLYKQAGNSIVVDVLYYIFVELYKAMPYLFDDLKLSSFFSGIGAFECALDRLYENVINQDKEVNNRG